MVKKLIKYDFKSYFRLILPIQLIVIGFAAINRLIQLFEPADISGQYSSLLGIFFSESGSGSSSVYNSVFSSSMTLYIISIAVCIIMTLIVSIVRFYQGMYTNEGYLSHTLPVTASQHISAKLLTSFIFLLGSLFAVFISFMVITSGDLNVEIFKAAGYIIGKVFAKIGGNLILYILEALVLFVIVRWHSFLKLYACVSVGQLAKKKKILLAFGVYFGIYVIKQILATVFFISFAVNVNFISKIIDQLMTSKIIGVHILLCSAIVYYAVLNLIYFVITKYIMSNKLNLT